MRKQGKTALRETNPYLRRLTKEQLIHRLQKQAHDSSVIEISAMNIRPPRDQVIRLRVTTAERAAITQAAEEAGQTISQYIRSRVV